MVSNKCIWGKDREKEKHFNWRNKRKINHDTKMSFFRMKCFCFWNKHTQDKSVFLSKSGFFLFLLSWWNGNAFRNNIIQLLKSWFKKMWFDEKDATIIIDANEDCRGSCFSFFQTVSNLRLAITIHVGRLGTIQSRSSFRIQHIWLRYSIRHLFTNNVH